jgi:hypothetical protein
MEQSNDVTTTPYKTASFVSAERAPKYKVADEKSNVDAQQSQLHPQTSSCKHGVISDNTQTSTTNIDEKLRAQLAQNGLHLMEFLGSGNFGTVFKAIQKKGEFDITIIGSQIFYVPPHRYASIHRFCRRRKNCGSKTFETTKGY